MKILLDSNIIIYSILPDFQYLEQIFTGNELYCSPISYVEVLGYNKITKEAGQLFESFFASSVLLPISNEVIKMATLLRQSRKMYLGDSLIAATALVNDLPLVTRNVSDFQDIPSLRVYNPIDDRTIKIN